jgi:acetyl esterase/lipase
MDKEYLLLFQQISSNILSLASSFRRIFKFSLTSTKSRLDPYLSVLKDLSLNVVAWEQSLSQYLFINMAPGQFSDSLLHRLESVTDLSAREGIRVEGGLVSVLFYLCRLLKMLRESCANLEEYMARGTFSLLRSSDGLSKYQSIRVKRFVSMKTNLMTLFQVWTISLGLAMKASAQRPASFKRLTPLPSEIDFLEDYDSEPNDSKRSSMAAMLIDMTSLPSCEFYQEKPLYLILLNATYASLFVFWNSRAPYVVKFILLIWYFLWYAIVDQDGAKEEASRIFRLNCGLEFASFVWNLSSYIAFFLSFFRANVHNYEGSINGTKIHVFSNIKLFEQDLISESREFESPKNEDHVGLSLEEEEVKEHDRLIQQQPSLLRSLGQTLFPPIMIMCHGGGFIGRNFPLEAISLSRQVKSSTNKFMIVYPFYTLKAVQPHILEEVMGVYQYFRARSPRVLLVGESAGGNIALSITLKAIKSSTQRPDGLILLYPAVSLNPSPSISKLLFYDDAILPVSLLKKISKRVIPQPDQEKQRFDAFLHPQHADRSDLAQFPTTFLLIAGLDALGDDTIDFNTRLRECNVSGDTKLYRDLPHGFAQFPLLFRNAFSSTEENPWDLIQKWQNTILFD